MSYQVNNTNKITDDQYIEVYDKIGCGYFGRGNDEELKEWGNSDKEIRKMKIRCVKYDLKFFKDGINTYRLLNELCGGTNIF